MARTVSIAVAIAMLAALQVGCGPNESSAAGSGSQLTLASADVRLGAGDQLGENMFRHYTEVARRRHERMAEGNHTGERADATSDNIQPWFVVLPHRGIVAYPGVMVLQPADGHAYDVTTVHTLLPS
jgi:hypothetical protein